MLYERTSRSRKNSSICRNKKQAQECMKEAAFKMWNVLCDQRWLGGMLTNFGTIRKN